MNKREKIAQLLCKQTGSNENRECETCPFNGCIAQRQADALIAANIGDVTAWKERAEKEKTEKNKWKCTANDWKQRFESREKQLAELRTTSCEAVIRKDRVISEQKSEIDRLSTERDEYKHRAEVAEKERDEYRNSNRIVLRGIEIIKRNILRYCATDFPTILQQAEKELAEEKDDDR